KMYIGMIYNNSSANTAGLKLDDQILEINGTDYRNCTTDRWCELIINNKDPFPGIETITILVLRDNKELSFKLDKRTLFEIH
ncbi:MAG TPA: PDZ domain-containing protein, partial [Bacteroidia bacterium]